jgi:hypothetical protein
MTSDFEAPTSSNPNNFRSNCLNEESKQVPLSNNSRSNIVKKDWERFKIEKRNITIIQTVNRCRNYFLLIFNFKAYEKVEHSSH